MSVGVYWSGQMQYRVTLWTLLKCYNKQRLTTYCYQGFSITKSQYLAQDFHYFPGVNFINVLLAAFAPVDPKSVKRYWQLDWIFTILRATGVKAARKNVDEIDGRHQFHQCSTSSSCTCRFQKLKKDWQLDCLYCTFRIWARKSLLVEC